MKLQVNYMRKNLKCGQKKFLNLPIQRTLLFAYDDKNSCLNILVHLEKSKMGLIKLPVLIER